MGIERQELVDALASLRDQRQRFLDQANAAAGAIDIVTKQIESLDTKSDGKKK